MTKKLVSLMLVVLMLVSVLGAVSANAEDGKFQSRTIKILSIWDETDPATNGYILNELSKEYGETVDNFKLDYEFVSIENLDQKVTTLMASDDLPEICIYESGKRLKKVIESGQILDLDKTLTELGIRDCVDDGAASLLINLVDGVGLYDLPLGLNVEGFWYNKALFAQAGVEVPTTWTEFIEVCDKLKTAGIVPIVQGGKDKWPMTRVLNAYVVRHIGLDAVKDAIEGTAKFTDAPYIEAAQMFQDMAKNEYFVKGMTTIDPGTATEMLMNGQAAMQYNGSWITQNLSQENNAAGPDGIGYFNVPVENENSTLDDYSMNCGNIMMFSAKKYDEAVGDWMKYVLPRIGDYSMQNFGTFKGFKINNMPEDLPIYTQIVGDALGTAKGAFLWFEAKMDSETSTLAQDNIALLYSGEMTAEEYMTQLQNSADKNR